MRIFSFPAETPFEEMEEALYFLTQEGNFLGLDVESFHIDNDGPGGYGPRGPRLRLVQFGSTTVGLVLNPNDVTQRSIILELLLDKNLRFVSHYSIDPEVIKLEFGIDITDRCEDTMTYSLLLDPRLNKKGVHGLKDLCDRFLDDELSKQAARLQRVFHLLYRIQVKPKGRLLKDEVSNWGWDNVPIHSRTYIRYAGMDAIYARRLRDTLRRVCINRGISEAAIDREMWLFGFKTRLKLRGWKIDVAHCEEVLQTVGLRNTDARQRVEDRLGCVAGSPKRADWLQERKVTIDARTKTGNPSLTHDSLVALSKRYPDNGEVTIALNDMLEVAETQNATTFVKSLLRFVDDQDYVHPEYDVLGAETGRMTVKRPAVQTVNKNPLVRGCFIADSPDHVLVSADMSQCEPRVLCALSQDPGLLEAVTKGKDIYRAIAEVVYNREVTKFERDSMKEGVLSVIYGKGIQGLADQLGITYPQAKTVKSTIKTRFPRADFYGRRLQGFLDFVPLPFGRAVPVDLERLYKNLNSMIQGTARDLFVIALQAIEAAGYGHMIVLLMHDEIILSVPHDMVDVVCKVVEDALCQPFKDVPFYSDIEIFPQRWANDGVEWLEPAPF